MQQTQQQNQMIINMLTTVQEDVEKVRTQQQLFETQIKRRLTNISTALANQTLTGHNKSEIEEHEEMCNERDFPESVFQENSRSNHYYSENSLIPEVVHEISDSTHQSILSGKKFNETNEYDEESTFNSFMVKDEKYGSLGNFPIATVDDYHRFENKLNDPEFFEAMVTIYSQILYTN